MRILVTGGTGVVGQATVTALVQRGHSVRLLSRNAEKDARQWPHGVEPWPGDVSDAVSIRGSADGCDAVLHCAGIVDEAPPEITFEKVNVGGTRNVVREGERGGVKKLVYVSSLGADSGESDYHRSKRRGEEIARTFRGDVVICRPGNVYGPGDEVVSLVLQMVRTLPAVPVIDGGDEAFQPLWADDAGRALAIAAERDDLAGRVLELAGPEQTSMNDLIERFSAITNRAPARVPIPNFLASLTTKIADIVGVDLPVNDSQLTMLREGNVIDDDSENALITVLKVTPTSLDDGLRKLADAQPEVLPSEGVGALKRKRFWADIRGGRHSAESLFEHVRSRFSEITPWHLDVQAEPGTPSEPRENETLTMSLPLRGNIQVRVNELTERSMTLVTLAGHPLAGAVRFQCEPRGEDVRFEIQVYDKASNFIDWISMSTVGGRMQNSTWESTVEKVVRESGGIAPSGVATEEKTLTDEEAGEVNSWLEALVMERKRESNAARPSRYVDHREALSRDWGLASGD